MGLLLLARTRRATLDNSGARPVLRSSRTVGPRGDRFAGFRRTIDVRTPAPRREREQRFFEIPVRRSAGLPGGPKRSLGTFKDAARKVRGAIAGRRKAHTPEPEATLHEEPLRMVGASGPLGARPSAQRRGWEVSLHDDFRRTFVSFCRQPFSTRVRREWWDMLYKRIDWNRPNVGERPLPRSAAWLTSAGCQCQYRYGRTSWPALRMEAWFLDLTDSVCRACGITQRPNSCNANLYEHGSDSVGWHADDEPLFDATRHDTLIVSLSLGATRVFELAPKDQPLETTQITLGDGDLCTMEGLCQKHYIHRVPLERRVQEARINLTWRWIVCHESSCPMSRKGHRNEPVPPLDGEKEVIDLDDDEPVIRRQGPRRGSDRPGQESRNGASLLKRQLESELPSEEQAKRQKRLERFGGGASSRSSAAPVPAAEREVEMVEPVTATISERNREVKIKEATSLAEKEIDSKPAARLARFGPRSSPAVPEKQVSRPGNGSEGLARQPMLAKRAARFGLDVAKPDTEASTAPPRMKAPQAAKQDGEPHASLDAQAERRRQRELRFAQVQGNSGPAAGTKKEGQPAEGTPTIKAAPAEVVQALSEADKRKLRAARFATS